MHRENSETDFGVIKIHKNVIASISSLAAIEVEGVKRVGTNLKSSLFELFGKKNISAIKVEIDKNEEVTVEIPLIIKYGFNIPETANSVQDNVHKALERMTGSPIRHINVNIKGIEKA